jgi:Fur family ferric uptake transcriptional regulator
LYDAVRRELPHVSLGTIYRNLDVLTKSGDVHRLDTSGGQARFDAEMGHHHHVRCVVCGRLDDVMITPEMEFTPPVASASGFAIQGYRVEFEGCCPACAESADSVRGGGE